MKAWSNIQIPLQDPEIIKINNLENNLGKLPEKVNQIRELITRFEVCHFKYQQHLNRIKNSIIDLQLNIDLSKIGINHLQHGENAWKNDLTGRSLIGQQYIWAIRKWLSNNPIEKMPEYYNKKQGKLIQKWLGQKNPNKKRLVNLLLARLTWDWKSYEKLQQGCEFTDLELQANRIDICHYAFPQSLDLLLQGIGEMKPVQNFEGCGSYNNSIKTNIEKEFSILNSMLKSKLDSGKSDKNELLKIWLMTCLAKTLKEQIELIKPIVEFVI